MTTVTITLADATQTPVAGVVAFYPLFTPQASGDSIIVGASCSAVVDSTGSGQIELLPGSYNVSVTYGFNKVDKFSIVVPAETETADLFALVSPPIGTVAATPQILAAAILQSLGITDSTGNWYLGPYLRVTPTSPPVFQVLQNGSWVAFESL